VKTETLAAMPSPIHNTAAVAKNGARMSDRHECLRSRPMALMSMLPPKDYG
jgi:hypothetical protein